MINKHNLNVFFSTLNFVLCFVGFQFFTSLLLPAVSDIDGVTRSVTVPYRAFALILSLVVIMINIKKTIHTYPIAMIVFLFFWLILIIRIFYDDFIRSDIRLGDTSQIWFYIFGICIPSIFSIIKSYKYINLEKTFWWLLILTGFTLVLTLFSNQALLVGADELGGRQGGNVAISTIAFGHLGTTSIILGFYTLLNKKLNWFYKLLIVLIICIGFFSMLRAGSRGPFMALVVVLLFWLFSRIKNPLQAIFSLIVVCMVITTLMDQILKLMGNISPIMEDRLRLSIYEGSTGGRDPYYTRAIEAFFESPIFGKQFVLIFSDGSFDYSHNLILDALMGLGVIGGGALIYFLGVAFKKSYYLIKIKDPHFWICLLLIQQIMSNMVSSAFYYNQLLSVLLVFIFLKYRSIKQINQSKEISN